MFNNNRIEITNYGLHSKKLDGGIKIAHLSDLHEKSFGAGNHRLFDIVREENPDIILITGDLVAHENQKRANTEYTETFARGISEIAPCFFVSGNHERQFDGEIKSILKASGISVLNENIESLDVRGQKINIAGIDDLSYGTVNVERAANIFDGVSGYNIFLTHQPQIYPLLLDKNVDLILAGHTHAGQIRLPIISQIYMYGQGWFPKYMQGEFTNGDTTMIISRGLGSSGYPTLRINNPPDLVIIYAEGEESEE